MPFEKSNYKIKIRFVVQSLSRSYGILKRDLD